MSSSQYSFVTRWKVQGTVEDVFRIIDDPVSFVHWWPSVWLRVEVLERSPQDGVGTTYRFLSKGWLPYLLCWSAQTREKEFPRRLVLSATGDFEGEGHWSFQPEADSVMVEYLWIIEARKPMLRYLSFLLKPVFAANHRWAMARGEESLKLELARRQARTTAEREAVPAPPPATFLSQRRRRSLGL